MRPTKLTEQVIEAFQAVLNDRHNAIVCTDYELFFLTNKRLPKEARISYRSFQRYKAAAKQGLEQDLEKIEAQVPEELEECMPDKEQHNLLERLHDLWCEAVIVQKNNLMDHIVEAKQGWQRFKWILERKFREWHPDYEGDPNAEISDKALHVVYQLHDTHGVSGVKMADESFFYRKEYLWRVWERTHKKCD